MNPQSVLSFQIFRSQIAEIIFLLLGFICAIGLRIAIGYPDTAHSTSAGLLFAACLGVLTIASRTKTKISTRIVIIGLAGGLFLCVPAIVLRVSGGSAHTPGGNYLYWSIIVAVVALAEEAFLRGALYERMTSFSNQLFAIIVTALLFVILHIPLYGLHSIPLNFVVGLWLGALRYQSGSFVAPGIAHVFADLAAWWII